MTKKEFILQHIAFEKGMIAAAVHMRNSLNMVINAHRKEATKKRAKELANMNKHQWRKHDTRTTRSPYCCRES